MDKKEKPIRSFPSTLMFPNFSKKLVVRIPGKKEGKGRGVTSSAGSGDSSSFYLVATHLLQKRREGGEGKKGREGERKKRNHSGTYASLIKSRRFN